MASRGVVPIKPGCGGAELVVLNLAKTLAHSGHHVTLVADVEPHAVGTTPGLQTVPVQSRWMGMVGRLPVGFLRWIFQHLLGNVAVAVKVRELLRGGAVYDVIHCHGNLSTVLISRLTSAPVVYSEHDPSPWRCRYRAWHERMLRKLIYRVVNGTAFRLADRVVTNFTEQIGDIEGLCRAAGKVLLIRNGTDVDIFTPRRSGVSRVEEQYGFERYCLFVGSLTARKSPDLLLSAVAESKSLACVFAGDGPMRRKLVRRATELGIKDKVAFLGNVPPTELGQLYAEADMLVLPSVSEGAPLVVLEAMACGIPVLATNIAGLPGMVQDWETGFLVKPGDVGQLAMAIRFLAGDENLRQRMGENGRKKALSEFPWSLVASDYAQLYAHLSRRTVEEPVLTGPTQPELKSA
jgi:glycosyltransferase involved in cell wall biosynthesis